MSNPETALAPVAPTAGMTLLQGYQAFSAGDTPAAYQMDDDELAELEGVKVRPTRIKFDGVKGRYQRVDDKDAKGWDELQAALLAKLDDSQVLFPRKNDTGQLVFPAEGGAWPAFICRADSIHGQARLHPDLTPEQIEIARQLRVQGALGGRCSQCVHSQWRNGEKPNCATTCNMLAFDSQTHQPSLLQVKGTSIKFLDRYLADYKREKRSLYSDVTMLASREVVEEGRRWQVMTFLRGEECGAESAALFREMRRTLKPLLEAELRSGQSTLLGADDELHDDRPAPTVPVGDSLPPVDLGDLPDVPF